ncbi:MAG: hypothetical protein IT347_01620 [Candidatus Eisenbacteria bacterium]|nr:hypothetical protein [Candidatus Eisenbacteria bacterium]
MTMRALRIVVLAGLLLAAAPVGAATASTPAKRAAAAKRPAVAQPPRPGTPAAAPGTEARRLGDVHIEGEVEVPRVTFITVRQPHRFTDYARATSVRPARRLATDATFPAWISPSPHAASDARKENRK